MKGQIVLVARRDDEFSATLRENGCEVINLELIRTEPIENLSKLGEKLKQLDRHDGVFITSRNAAEIFANGLVGRNFQGKTYVLGERSRTILENAGLKIEFRENANTVEELINLLGTAEFSDKKLLFVRGNRSMRTVPEMLGGIAHVDEVEVYRTIDTDIDEACLVNVGERLEKREIDWICFFSPSAVARFIELFDANDAKIAVIGKTTGNAAKEAGLNLQFVSPNTTSKDFAISFIKDRHFAKK